MVFKLQKRSLGPKDTVFCGKSEKRRVLSNKLDLQGRQVSRMDFFSFLRDRHKNTHSTMDD